jgi:hypothetical protein
MIKSIQHAIIPILLVFLLAGCAQRGDHNPLGITGGSDGGYGRSQDLYRESSSIQDDNNIYGLWANNNLTVTLNSDGTFELKSDQKINVGTFIRLKDTLTLKFRDGSSITYSYTLTKDRLVLIEME